MTLEMEHNIDMILVNPSEEERIRSTFTMNGMIKEASLIISSSCLRLFA